MPAVQGGLLAGAVARRHETHPDAGRHKHLDDVAPVGGFLAGKLASHTLAGALLGLVGDAAQRFHTRALMQIGAGVVMILVGANLLGARTLRRLVPPPPPAVSRFVRRRARSQAILAPAVLGFATVLIPCGVTLSVMVLAVASGSPLLGALGMAVFVLGTSPLFAVLGYAVRRSGNLWRGYLGKAAAVAVMVAGLLSINSGLILTGSPVTLETAWEDLTGGRAQAAAGPGPGQDAAVTVDGAGVQHIVIELGDSSYSPSRVQARAGLPTRLTLRTNGTQGCTRGFVVPAAGFETTLPETGDTVLDLGESAAGRITYTCSMGMYRGEIDIA